MLELGQPIPQRLHLAGADAAQDRGERCGPVAALILARERADLGRVLGEQRLRAPALDEVLVGVAFEIVGERSVGAPPLRALGVVLDAGRRRDEHQTPHPLGRGERDVQRDAPALRVAAQREALRRARQHVLDAARERDRARRVGELAVARQVERQRPVAFAGQQRHDPVPGAAGTAEAVQ